MRIPFLKKRERTPTLYQKGIQDEFDLNNKAQLYLVQLFIGVRNPIGKLDFVFEQIYIIYNLAIFTGSHEVSVCARKALCRLREEYETDCLTLGATTSIQCSQALKEGLAILQELPRSEFKTAYVQAKRISESLNSIKNYLKVFND